MGGCRRYFDRHWGWVVTGASFLLYLVCCGSLGVFVLLYIYFERDFKSSAVAIGWIGSLGNGLLNLLSFVSSPLYERFTHRTVIILGVLLSGGGILATSFTTSLWQIYITFGIIFGVGLNFINNPALNIITVYFPGRNCVRATALATSGHTVGTLLLTPLLQAVLSVNGWRTTLQILSIVILVTCLPLSMVFQPPPPRSTTTLNDQDLSLPEKEKLKVNNLSDKKEQCCKERNEQIKIVRDTELGGPPHVQETLADDEPNLKLSTTGDNIESQETESNTLMNIDEDYNEVKKPIPPLQPNDKYTSGSKACEDKKVIKDSMETSNNNWDKYIALIKDPRHWCLFVGILAAVVSITFNWISLVSCMTTGGIPESTSVWLITLLNVAGLVSRLLVSFKGDHLPIKKITVLIITAGVGAVSSFLLTGGTFLWIFIVYCITAGCVRGVLLGIAIGCVVELFGAHKTVETLTSLLIAYGVGGLLASSVAGLSYDITGSYQASHYTCSVLWMVSCIMFIIVYKWSYITSWRSNISTEDSMGEETL